MIIINSKNMNELQFFSVSCDGKGKEGRFEKDIDTKTT
jgi:hypothetical protein